MDAADARASLPTPSPMLGRAPRYLVTFVRGAGVEQLTTVDRQLLAQLSGSTLKRWANARTGGHRYLTAPPS
jgi:hypothetical protein